MNTQYNNFYVSKKIKFTTTQYNTSLQILQDRECK